MRALLRSAACVGALLPFVLLVAGSALAVTVTQAVNQDRNTISNGTAEQSPYCSGTYVRITGTGFVSDGGVTSVMIANVPALNVNVGSDNTLYAQVGPKATDGPVIVTTKLGSATAPQTYTILPCAAQPVTTKPAISYYRLPSQTQGHQSIKVKGGKNFYVGGTSLLAVSSVTVGGKPAVYAVASDYNLQITMPKTAANGKLTVKVVAPGGTTISPSTLTLTKTA